MYGSQCFIFEVGEICKRLIVGATYKEFAASYLRRSLQLLVVVVLFRAIVNLLLRLCSLLLYEQIKHHGLACKDCVRLALQQLLDGLRRQETSHVCEATGARAMERSLLPCGYHLLYSGEVAYARFVFLELLQALEVHEQHVSQKSLCQLSQAALAWTLYNQRLRRKKQTYIFSYVRKLEGILRVAEEKDTAIEL